MAWILVVLFLAITCGIVYYIFEISEQFNILALEHVQKYHNTDKELTKNSKRFLTRMWNHLMDIPLAFWFLLFMVPYIQVFCMLLACTKPQPQFSLAYLWPIYFFIRCRGLYMRCRGPGPEKSVNIPISNGHKLIDTWSSLKETSRHLVYSCHLHTHHGHLWNNGSNHFHSNKQDQQGLPRDSFVQILGCLGK